MQHQNSSEICRSWKDPARGCPNGMLCQNQHEGEGAVAEGAPNTKVAEAFNPYFHCRIFTARGRCNWGSDCKFAHFTQEQHIAQDYSKDYRRVKQQSVSSSSLATVNNNNTGGTTDSPAIAPHNNDGSSSQPPSFITLSPSSSSKNMAEKAEELLPSVVSKQNMDAAAPTTSNAQPTTAGASSTSMPSSTTTTLSPSINAASATPPTSNSTSPPPKKVDHDHCTHNHNKNSFKDQACNNYKLGHCRQGLICPNQHTGNGNITKDAPDHVLALAFKRDFCVNFAAKGECSREKSGEMKCLLTHFDREKLLEDGRNIYMQRRAWSENMLRSGALPPDCNAWCHPEKGGCKRGALCPMKHDPNKKGKVAEDSPTWRQAIAWNGGKMCLRFAIHKDCPDINDGCKFQHLTLQDLTEKSQEILRKSAEDDSCPATIPGAADDPLHPPLFLDMAAFEKDFLARRANPKHGSTTDEERRRGRMNTNINTAPTANTSSTTANNLVMPSQQQQHQLPPPPPPMYNSNTTSTSFFHGAIITSNTDSNNNSATATTTAMMQPPPPPPPQSSSSSTSTSNNNNNNNNNPFSHPLLDNPDAINDENNKPTIITAATQKCLVLSKINGFRDLPGCQHLYSPLQVPPPLLVRRDPTNPHIQQLMLLPKSASCVTWPPPLVPVFREEEIPTSTLMSSMSGASTMMMSKKNGGNQQQQQQQPQQNNSYTILNVPPPPHHHHSLPQKQNTNNDSNSSLFYKKQEPALPSFWGQQQQDGSNNNSTTTATTTDVKNNNRLSSPTSSDSSSASSSEQQQPTLHNHHHQSRNSDETTTTLLPTTTFSTSIW